MKNINTKKKLYRVLFFLISWLLPFQFIHAQWVQTNGPYGGEIRSLALSNNGAGGTNIFAGTNGYGLFRSTDSGSSWNGVNVGLPVQNAIYTLAISGTNIFAGTWGNGDGVYLSTNNGISWTSVSNGLSSNPNIASLVVSGTNLFAGTVYSGGIFRSTNYGAIWTAINNGLPANVDVNALAVNSSNIFAGTSIGGIFHSTDNGTNWIYSGFKDTTILSLTTVGTNIFAGTFNSGVFLSTNNGTNWVKTSLRNIYDNAFAVSGKNIFAGTGTSGVFLSTDNGANWKAVNNGLPTNYWVWSLAVFSNGGENSNILAGTSVGVFLSTNNGTSWTEVNTGLTGTQVLALAVSGSNIFAGTRSGVFLSTNDGNNWSSVNNGFISYNVIYASALAVSGSNIFVGIIDYNNGIFLSTNNGASWIGNGMPQGQVQSIVISPAGKNGSNIFAGTIGQGVFLSTNNGGSWSVVNTGLTNKDIFSLAIASDGAGGTNIFAGTWGSGVFLSTNNGSSWTAVNNDLLKNAYVGSLVVSSNGETGGMNLFASASGVYLSTNNGTSWNSINNNLPDGGFLALSGMNLFSSDLGGVFLSTNNGTNWTNVSQGLPTQINFPRNDILSFVISDFNIFAGTWGGCVWRRPLSEMISSVWQDSIKIKDNGNISQSLTFGQSPSATDGIDSGLSEAPLPPAPFGFDARFHFPSGDESWTDYRSSGKETIKWVIKFQPGNGGYPMTFSWDKSVLPKGKVTLTDAVTGTIVNVDMTVSSSYTLTNSGINSLIIQYIAASTPTSVKNINSEIPTEFSLMQNFPNPFNPATVIKYGLPGISNVKLKIYNVLGQLIETLVNGTQQAGFHEVTWNASNKASGVYLCSIEAVSTDNNKTFYSVKKLLLLK